VGAHWLHQSLFYALDGHNVVAADFPATLELENVKKRAADSHIALIDTSLLTEKLFSVLCKTL